MMRRIARGSVMAILLFAPGSTAARVAESNPPGRFTETAWRASASTYASILDHPFLTGLQDGRLPRAAFKFYMIQDTHYLREFARALTVTAAKAPKAEWRTLFERHATETLDAERELHETVFADLGISAPDVEAFEPSPEAFGYTSFLVATAHEGTFAESLAALLPCYWIYWEVGKQLVDRGSQDAVYQQWIEQYSSSEYGATVDQVLAIVDEVAQGVPVRERERMVDNFSRSARYEWMFWDSAYRQAGWPPDHP